MKRKICLLLSVATVVSVISACKKTAPDEIVRKTCFDEYLLSDSEYKGEAFGKIIKDFTHNTIVQGVGKLWEEEYTVNSDIPYLSDVELDYDSDKEDIVCLTLSEHIEYQSPGDEVLAYIFSVNKSTQEVAPEMSFRLDNGDVKEDSIEEDPKIIISTLYAIFEYMESDVEYLKENVY